MSHKIAGIDVHKKLLYVVVRDVTAPEERYERKRFLSTASQVAALRQWLQERGVEEVVMESTAQYWKPVWYELESHFRLHLAQARSNRGARGRKRDFADAERLVRRLVAGELILSYVPDREQRVWRTMTRSKCQLRRERVRLHSQIEALLEEMRIKLSSVISDLLGVSGLRILGAVAAGESDAAKLAALGEDRLRCTPEQLTEALRGNPEPTHRQILKLFLERVELVDRQIQQLDSLIAEALRQQQEQVVRLAQVPGLGVDSAQQLIAEIGPAAQAFPTAGQLAAWVGVCPGREESAGVSHSDRSPKGNRYLRRLLAQAAQAAVKKNGSRIQAVFRRLLPRLGYTKALWAIAHRLCRLIWKILHEQVEFVEQGLIANPQAQKRRAQKMIHALRKLGYNVQITPSNA